MKYKQDPLKISPIEFTLASGYFHLEVDLSDK